MKIADRYDGHGSSEAFWRDRESKHFCWVCGREVRKRGMPCGLCTPIGFSSSRKISEAELEGE
jgi:hypothetical protein